MRTPQTQNPRVNGIYRVLPCFLKAVRAEECGWEGASSVSQTITGALKEDETETWFYKKICQGNCLRFWGRVRAGLPEKVSEPRSKEADLTRSEGSTQALVGAGDIP